MVVAASGCALVAMIARICASGKKYAAVHVPANDLAERADALRERILQLKEADERAFDAVVAARGNTEAMQTALAGAAAAPLQGAEAALEVLLYTGEALDLGNAHLISDVGCAAEFAFAALAGCAYNVRINHKFMKDANVVQTQARKLEQLEADGRRRLQDLRSAVSGGLS